MKASLAMMIFLRSSIGLTLALLFWWLIGSRLTIPAWQVAVLPAALLGFITVYGERRWSVLLAGCVLAGSLLSGVAGEWLHVYGRLLEAHDRSFSDNAEESVLAAIAKHQSEMEKEKSGANRNHRSPPMSVCLRWI